MQLAAGAATELLTPDQIKARYPFYTVDDLVLGSINTRDEGYFDGSTVFEWWRRQARERGVEYVTAEVVALTRNMALDYAADRPHAWRNPGTVEALLYLLLVPA